MKEGTSRMNDHRDKKSAAQEALDPEPRWVPVPGWEDRYEVSSDGRVRSLTRYDYGRKGRTRIYVGRELRPYTRVSGYKWVTLARHGMLKSLAVHVIVLTAFRSERPDGLVACHGNGVRGDNRLSNLRWDTISANVLDEVRHGSHRNASKTVCIRGHRLDEANTYLVSTGARRCRTCATEYRKRRYWSSKAMVAAYPPDKSLEPAPDTDPKFWER